MATPARHWRGSSPTSPEPVSPFCAEVKIGACQPARRALFSHLPFAQVVELVDTQVSEACA